jgi:hypothetical protein
MARISDVISNLEDLKAEVGDLEIKILNQSDNDKLIEDVRIAVNIESDSLVPSSKWMVVGLDYFSAFRQGLRKLH